ncbi:glycosyltransferase family 4 protein [Anaeromyxobacter sp. K]|uniref:glycosyltransferase family 4 protein n=1 Tax=Anaeromyxobacter sp. (strain K) TaxID=447217 RepID=UPI00059CBD85|nr:glycosyltransferase family 4 protein [Anaeromyxobacter sp. K]
MTPLRFVLLIDHSGPLGGAAVSLRALAVAVDPARFRLCVALARPSAALREFYRSAGLQTVDAPGIGTFEHTTARWARLADPASWPLALHGVAGWARSERSTLELVRAQRPALVHLSSAVLAPSARALHRAGAPFVWHVREMPAGNSSGWRTARLRAALRGWPARALFISEVARRSWVGDAPGAIVGEPLDLDRFDPALDRAVARRALGIVPDARVVLYGGGNARIKGVLPLIEAIARLRRLEPRAVCLMPGGELVAPRTALYRGAATLLPLVGARTLTQRIERAVDRLGLEPALLRRPFTQRMELHLAACDVVAFPALVDHFARPVVEAAAMARPVVASRLPMIAEQVRDGETGLLVPPGDPVALAQALAALLADPDRARGVGSAARAALGRRFDARLHAERVMAEWDAVLRAGDQRQA